MIDVYYEFGNVLYLMSATFGLLVAILYNFNEKAILPCTLLLILALVGAVTASLTVAILGTLPTVLVGSFLVYKQCQQQ